MFRLSMLLTVVVACLTGTTVPPPALADTTIPGGLIDEDTVWTLSGSPYFIDGDVFLAEGVLLEIEPGVEVRFRGGDYLTVSGQLVADGLPETPIGFVGDDHDGKKHDAQLDDRHCRCARRALG